MSASSGNFEIKKKKRGRTRSKTKTHKRIQYIGYSCRNNSCNYSNYSVICLVSS